MPPVIVVNRALVNFSYLHAHRANRGEQTEERLQKISMQNTKQNIICQSSNARPAFLILNDFLSSTHLYFMFSPRIFYFFQEVLLHERIWNKITKRHDHILTRKYKTCFIRLMGLATAPVSGMDITAHDDPGCIRQGKHQPDLVDQSFMIGVYVFLSSTIIIKI